ncbi:DoxX family protein [Streptomyces bambusae]|uniref:DoxX family membrane protein n=1 Tax=Streptomyces bambusae TaxID=1550616 RepID=A0ABS6Z8U5_9ACTN|nr:DoxX family protein [Streptomyces bambusae]MBW5484157.1 DoxX family membrane protein [Streptomyces bambusae]
MTTAPIFPGPRTPATAVTPYDIGLPVLRLVLGAIMAVHGTQKLFRWFDGPGLKTTGMFFEKGGYPAGETMAVIAGVTETLGGLGLILGLLTPLAGAAIVGVMINAIAVKWAGEVIGQVGVELESLIIAAAATLALTGPGRFALDRFVPVLRDHRVVYGVAALALGVVLAFVVLMFRD